ncbi:MAG: hypothetical protein J6W71_03765 [Methanobrevibacter sp.]|nr:hypothetical protein [Methanobrevibacter sp.]
MNLSWYLFYGRKLGMSKAEILATTTGEMADMMACMAIYSGNMKAKRKQSMESIIFDM